MYEGPDPGIDGALLFLDDRAVFSEDELNEIFDGGKREYHVSIIFTQVKSSITWSKMEIDSFIASISDFLSESPAQPHSQYLSEFKNMFKKVFENIGRIKMAFQTSTPIFIGGTRHRSDRD